MALGPLQVNEDDRFTPPARAERPESARQGGLVKWGIAAVAVVVFAGSLWLAFQRGAMQKAGDYLPPLIKADPRPTKRPPDEPGGLEVPNRDMLVYERLITDQPDKHVERLLPPPEAPLAKPKPETSTPVVVGSTPVVPPPAEPAPKSPPRRRTTELTLTVDPATGEPRPPANAPTPPASKPSPAAPTAVVPQPAAPRAVASAPAKAEAAPARATRYGVQLAALRDKSGAPNEWRRLKAAFGSILGRLDTRVVRTDLGKRGIFYRLIAGNFADQERARAACAELQALKQDCLVVTLE